MDKVIKSTKARLNIIRDAVNVLVNTPDKDRAKEAYIIISRNVNDIITTLRFFRNDMYQLLKLKLS